MWGASYVLYWIRSRPSKGVATGLSAVRHCAAYCLFAFLMNQRLLLVALVLCACGVHPAWASPTSCYVDSGGLTPATLTSMGAPIPAGTDAVCVRYCLVCQAGDPACTNAQIASSSSRVAYTYVITSTASQMQATPSVYPNFYSCTTTDCNTVVSSCSASAGGPASPTSGASAGSAVHLTALLLVTLVALALP